MSIFDSSFWTAETTTKDTMFIQHNAYHMLWHTANVSAVGWSAYQVEEVGAHYRRI